MKTKAKIMIVDDAEMNREILMVILGDEYEYVQAENGRQAIHILQQDMNIDLMLLDINMPEMNGFQVLDRMNTFHWINDIPVIMISSEEKKDVIERAYILGAEDYIRRPFDAFIVRRRVQNILNLYANQKRLMQMVADQIYEKEENNNLMIGILSHVVEFRNSESGEHILHIRTATELLLRRLVQKTDEYHLSESDIVMITTASALHDIGKISIPESILNKPGKLTREEFSIIKTHTSRAGQCIINICQCNHLCRDRNLLSNESIRVAVSIPPFMVPSADFSGNAQQRFFHFCRHLIDNIRTNRCMCLYNAEFLPGQFSRLV